PFRWHHMKLGLQNFDPNVVRELLTSSEPRTVRIQRPSHEVVIANHTLSLGASILHLFSARLEGQFDSVNATAAAGRLEAELVHGESSDGYVELIQSAPPQGPRLDNAERSMLADIGKGIRELEPEAQIWLYGSRARGQARTDADWDIAIVLPGPI